MSDEMVEKARAHATGKKWDDFYLMFDDLAFEFAASFARSAVQDAVRQCIAEVEHFANDELTAEEWRAPGLAARENRGDFGYIAFTAEKIASALRKKFEVDSAKGDE